MHQPFDANNNAFGRNIFMLFVGNEQNTLLSGLT